MEKILAAISEIAEKMKEKGYDYFNVWNGGMGVNFKDALDTYLSNVSTPDQESIFPIYAASGVKATDPGNPVSWATFTIIQDANNGLRVDSMNISMYESHDGPLRTSINLSIKSLEDILSKQDADKLIEAHWQKIRLENISKWGTPDPANTGTGKRKKL